MVSLAAARKLALSLPEAVERDHFGSPSFRVKGKIFAQLSDAAGDERRPLVKLSVADQAALIMSDPDTFSSVQQWGRYGWTHVQLARVGESMLRKALCQSWRPVAPKKLIAASSDAYMKKNRTGG
ncbi:MAG: MmcQ/YjbR family DNA-binding protein [Rhodanobacteraceae bacterium]